MLRIDEIQVRAENSKFSLSELQEILDNSLRVVASATSRTIVQDSLKVTAVFYKPISLQTVNKILNSFSKKRIKILKLNWNRKVIGPVIRGYLEIIVS